MGVAVVLLPSAAWRALREPRAPANATVLFALLAIVWVALLANLLELGENNRFRLLVEPLFWVVVVAEVDRRLRRRG